LIRPETSLYPFFPASRWCSSILRTGNETAGEEHPPSAKETDPSEALELIKRRTTGIVEVIKKVGKIEKKLDK